ncbi:MAG TPA: NADH-quinone oxidoreductase subunit C [Chthoniobacterales bacterium]
MSAAEAAVSLENQFSDLEKIEFRGETTLLVPVPQLEPICRCCKEQLGFDLLLDISSVDHFGDEPRFEVVYELYSLEQRTHLRLKAKVSEDALEVPTVSSVWATANWHEREIYDMMGIRFGGHPDLRRILMWDGYPFYPLRKDFPLEGKPSDLPDVAFTGAAPLAGGPFVSPPSAAGTKDREPRARHPETPGNADFQGRPPGSVNKSA